MSIRNMGVYCIVLKKMKQQSSVFLKNIFFIKKLFTQYSVSFTTFTSSICSYKIVFQSYILHKVLSCCLRIHIEKVIHGSLGFIRNRLTAPGNLFLEMSVKLFFLLFYF